MRFILAFALLCLPTTLLAQAKMGSNMICYDNGDPYYAQIHTTRVYATMVECVDAGGRDRQTTHDQAGMEQVENGRAHRGRVPTPVSLSRMARQFDDLDQMDNWVLDTRHQGCREQRDRLLAHTSTVRVEWQDDGCRVRMGHWRDIIDGKKLTDPERIELTHLVPLTWAEARGALNWTAEMRHRFYHDRRNLITTTSAGRNALEGRTPLDWRPFLPWSACHHAQSFWSVTQAYPIALTPLEQVTLVAAVENACQPMTHDQITQIHQAQRDLAQAQREAIDTARSIQRTQVDALRAQNAPPAPSYIRLPDGSTRALTMEERWGGTWRTHVREDIARENANRVAGFGSLDTRTDVTPLTPTRQAERPPIALPGTYGTNPNRALSGEPNRFGQQGSMMATEQTDVGGPNDLGDFGDVVLPPSLEGLDRLGDDLPELDAPGSNPEALIQLLQDGIPGISERTEALDTQENATDTTE